MQVEIDGAQSLVQRQQNAHTLRKMFAPHPHSLGTRLGWCMTKPDRALRRPCFSAGQQKPQLTPSHSGCPQGNKSQEQRKHKHKSYHQVLLPPLELLRQKRKAVKSKLVKVGTWFFNMQTKECNQCYDHKPQR